MRSFGAALLMTTALAASVHAQSTSVQDKYKNARPGAAASTTVVIACPGVDSFGNPIAVVCAGLGSSSSGPYGGASTQTPGVTSNTAGSFGVAPIAVADANRKDCDVDNTSNDYMYIFFGIGVSPSPNPTNSIPILPGNSYRCNNAGVVKQDAIWLASRSTASAPYVLVLVR